MLFRSAELLGYTSLDEVLNPTITRGSVEDLDYTLGLYCADNNKELLSGRLFELIRDIVSMPEGEGIEILEGFKKQIRH